MNVIFLDFDGVVNTPLWMQKDGEWKCRIGQPLDGKVNNFQAVQWVSEFCIKHDYSIVVSSTWRYDPDYDTYLIQGGLRRGVEIYGRTPVLEGKTRGEEIGQYLAEHPEVTGYLIFDDDDDMGEYLNHLVKCDYYRGFAREEFHAAELLHLVLNQDF